MKKLYVSLLVVSAAVAFACCTATRPTASASKPVVKKINYADNVMGVLQTSCAPCHFPDKGGNKKALDTYAAVTGQIDEVLRRVQLQPNERGFMPRQKPRLSDSTINMLKQWKAEGLAEK